MDDDDNNNNNNSDESSSNNSENGDGQHNLTLPDNDNEEDNIVAEPPSTIATATATASTSTKMSGKVVPGSLSFTTTAATAAAAPAARGLHLDATTTSVVTKQESIAFSIINATAIESWDIEQPPEFHCPKLMSNIGEIIPGNQPLLTKLDVINTNTVDCRRLAPNLKYRGRKDKGTGHVIRCISSNGSKLDMQRRLMTWYFCYNRQMKGLPCLPPSYEPPSMTAWLEYQGSKKANLKSSLKRKHQSSPSNNNGNATATATGGDNYENDYTPIFSSVAVAAATPGTSTTAAPTTTNTTASNNRIQRALAANGDQAASLEAAERMNLLREQTALGRMNVLQELYKMRRDMYDELIRLDEMVEDPNRTSVTRDRAQRQRESEEQSIVFVNEQIAKEQSQVIRASNRRPL